MCYYIFKDLYIFNKNIIKKCYKCYIYLKNNIDSMSKYIWENINQKIFNLFVLKKKNKYINDINSLISVISKKKEYNSFNDYIINIHNHKKKF